MMSRKPDWPPLVLFAAMLFGVVVRFSPALLNRFPLNDGGMFYAMVQDLEANDYLLPEFTTYNMAGIPFTYPPLGMYIAAFLSDLLPLADTWGFLWLPALISSLSIILFYQFASQVLASRWVAALGTLIYALSPRSFLWQVMGGGVTRTFGMLFLLLMMWQAIQLFREYTPKRLALTVLFGAGAILGHPQTALHAALGGALLFLFYGLNWRGILSAMLTVFGVTLATVPWWGPVLSRHGIAPFISAGQTSQRTVESYLGLIRLDGLGDTLFLPTLLLAFIGMWAAIRRRDYFLVTWALLAQLIDPRGGEGVALLPISMLAALGLTRLFVWITRSDGGQDEVRMQTRAPQILLLSLTGYLFLVASLFDLQLVNTSLKTADLEMMRWVNENVEDEKTFLLASGREFSMSDPLQEWFPALTHQHSATTMQGLEWISGDQFFPWYEQVIAFQHCAEVGCVTEWSTRNGVDYDYLVVIIPPESDLDDLANSVRSLGLSARTSALHLLVYETEHVMVFELGK
jgi:hypothetical protein